MHPPRLFLESSFSRETSFWITAKFMLCKFFIVNKILCCGKFHVYDFRFVRERVSMLLHVVRVGKRWSEIGKVIEIEFFSDESAQRNSHPRERSCCANNSHFASMKKTKKTSNSNRMKIFQCGGGRRCFIGSALRNRRHGREKLSFCVHCMLVREGKFIKSPKPVKLIKKQWT